MEYLFDTANLALIEEYSKYIPITGVTTNPSIVKKEGSVDFFAHMRKIRACIGMERSLHIQVTGTSYETMMSEAEAILENVDRAVYIKVPVTLPGLQVIRALKAQKVNVTATAIYTEMQGLLALEAGADYLAPYYNRMENNNIDPEAVIGTLAAMIEKYHYQAKILAASFKNMGQVNKAFRAGAQTATIGIEIFRSAFDNPAIEKAVKDFAIDWASIHGGKLISEL